MHTIIRARIIKSASNTGNEHATSMKFQTHHRPSTRSPWLDRQCVLNHAYKYFKVNTPLSLHFTHSLTRTKTLLWLYIFKYWQNLMLYHGMTWKTHSYLVNVDTDWYLPDDSLLMLVLVKFIDFGLRLYPRNSLDLFSTSVFTISTSRCNWWLPCSRSIFRERALYFRAQTSLAE